MANAYPLQWPVGRPRWHGSKKQSKFKMTEFRITDHLFEELERLGAKDIVVSTNRQPYSRSKSQPEDTGVAVYFTHKGKELCIACDKWNKVEHNLHAVGMAIEAMRGLERWGTGDMVDAAFSGFTAIPSGFEMPAPQMWYQVLGVGENASQDDIKAAYRKLAHEHHPDKGGDTESFNRIQMAYEEGLRQCS